MRLQTLFFLFQRFREMDVNRRCFVAILDNALPALIRNPINRMGRKAGVTRG